MSGEMAKNKAYSNNEKLSKKQFVSTYGSLIGLILLIIIITVLRPRFISPANLRNVFRNASINGLLAIGMTFVVLTEELIFLLVQSWDVQVCILHILHSLSKDIQRSWQF